LQFVKHVTEKESEAKTSGFCVVPKKNHRKAGKHIHGTAEFVQIFETLLLMKESNCPKI